MTAMTIHAMKVGASATAQPASFPSGTAKLSVPPPPPPSQLVGPSTTEQNSAAMRAFFAAILPPVMGLVLLLAIWQLATMNGGSIPTPGQTWEAATKLFADPFYRNGPNDQGIGWNILSSLQRVAVGFGFAALVGIPVGFLLGRFATLSSMANPIISLLRPVSPLAWLPIGLLVFKKADPAATWTIFICSIWPMIMNTAQGVVRVPQDYLNVARVLNLSEWKIVTKILFPSVLPYMLTGIRLSIGTAWLVIVAAEMLTGGVGIGFWVWDEWNNLKVEHIIIAIFVIGIVGLILEQTLLLLAKRLHTES
ncbi:nitrate ABC transporter permease [Sulfuricystis thermophila]|uniref:nitrate ABC transporter permease n=1 Tax=Sulfuricystis thermophila TaxID=2496847 RepID=UPI0010366EC4|nr:nitrate ABC transporter permease [Sulfuricystis thermophila]